MKTQYLRFEVEGFDGGIESNRAGDIIEISYQSMPVMAFSVKDLTARDWTIAALLRAGLKGKTVAALCHVTPSRVSELRKVIREGGLDAISHRPKGRKPKLTGQRLQRARQCRRDAMTLEKIASEFGVSLSVVARAVHGIPRGRKPQQVTLEDVEQKAPQTLETSAIEPWPEETDSELGEVAETEEHSPDRENQEDDKSEELRAGKLLPDGQDEHPCRYAGTLLICAAAQALGLFTAMVKASVQRPKTALYSAQQAVMALLCAWASGLGSIEAMHERDARALGVVLGLERSPSVRTLHRAIAQMVAVFDPIALLSQFLQGLIAAIGQVPRIFGVDGHFKPYFGKEPIDKGYDTKRRIAHKGLGNVLVHDEQGRIWSGVEVSPSEHLHEHLSSTAKTLRAELGEDEDIVLGFDRGGWCFETFNELNEEGFGYVAWMPSSVKTPKLSTIAPTDDGVAQQPFEHKSLDKDHRARLLVERDGDALVPAMTNLGDEVSAAEALEMLRSVRGMQENDIKAARSFAHIDRLVDRGNPTRRGDDRLVDNPDRVALKKKRRKIRDRREELDRRQPISRKDKAACGGESLLAELEEALLNHQMSQVPKEVERQQLDPTAERAWLKTKNRALLQPLKYLLANARRWLLSGLGWSLAPSDHDWDQSALNRTLESLIRAPGVIVFGPQKVEVFLDLPLPPQPHKRLSRGLEELSDLNLLFSDGQRRVVFRLQPRPKRSSLPSAHPRDGDPGNSNS